MRWTVSAALALLVACNAPPYRMIAETPRSFTVRTSSPGDTLLASETMTRMASDAAQKHCAHYERDAKFIEARPEVFGMQLVRFDCVDR